MAEPDLMFEAETPEPVLLSDAVAMFAALEAALGEYAVARGTTVHAAFRHVRTGSLLAQLAVYFEIIDKALPQRELLGGFVNNMADTIEILLRKGARATAASTNSSPAAERAIETFAQPVAEGRIVTINLFVQGSNDNRLIIDQVMARAIGAAFAERRHGESEPMDVDPTAFRDRPRAPGEWPWKPGTAHYRDGQWWVLLDGQSEMHKLGMPSGTMDDLVDGARYQFSTHGPSPGHRGEVLAKAARREDPPRGGEG